MGEAPVEGIASGAATTCSTWMLDVDGDAQQSVLAEFGPSKKGKVCLCFKRLTDVGASILAQLGAGTAAAVSRRYG